MATPSRLMQGNAPQEVQMSRLSKSLLDQLGVRLDHSDLKKLGYRAEKRPNNPNTYYKVPGLHSNIENCPKVVKYIKQVHLQGKKQELEKLLGKGVAPKLPPTSHRRAATAADVTAEDQEEDEEEEGEEEEGESELADEEMEEAELVEEEEGEAAVADQPPPPGFVYVTGEKQDKVLDGMASYISAQTHLKGISGADLLAKGMRAVEESRPLAPGERMRHAFVWWHNRMQEPLRCAQYIFAAKNLLEMDKAREGLGLPPVLPKAAAAGGSASVPAKKRPSTASEGMLTPPAPSSAAAASAKRTRTSTGDAAAAKTPAAPASAPPASNAVVGSGERTGRHTKAAQAAAAAAAGAGASSAGGAAAAAAGARASHFPVSPSQSGGGAAAAAGKTRGSSKAAAGGSGAAGGKSSAAGAALKLGAGNQQVLDSVDDAVKLLGEALELARSLPPSVLNSLPSVFTAGLDGTLQEFLSAATTMHEGLRADRELLVTMASDYAAELAAAGTAATGGSSRGGRVAAAAAAESHYRRPYLAFRAALGSCAADAHAWLQDKQQREMIARLEGLCQIKQQLEDKKSQEEQLRQEQESMRLQKERLEQELKAYKERLKQMEEEHRRKSAAALAAVAAEAAAAAAAQQQAGCNGGSADAAAATGTDQAA